MMLYQKIPGPYKRDMQTNRVTPGVWTSEALEALAEAPIWTATEKIDGMNIRALWDGYRVTFGGRTDRAELPGDLVVTLENLFPEEKFEATFGATPVVIFGEGYGPKIQNGGKYRTDKSFAMFDVAVDGKYLRPADSLELADSWGIEHVPALFPPGNPVTLERLIYEVENTLGSQYGDFEAEGLVAKTVPGLLDHRGDRIIVKIKGRDFSEGV